MSDHRDEARSGGDEFSGFLAEVERSMAEALAPGAAPEPRGAPAPDQPPAPAPVPASGPDPRAAAREAWLTPERFVGDFVDIAARLAEDPA